MIVSRYLYREILKLKTQLDYMNLKILVISHSTRRKKSKQSRLPTQYADTFRHLKLTITWRETPCPDEDSES